MKNLKTTALFILLLVVFFSCNNSSQKEETKAGKSFVFDSRVEELLGKMTIEDKVGQMCQYVGLEHIKHAEKNLTKEELANNDAHGFYPDLHSSDVAKMIEKGIIGSFLHTLTAKEANYLQSLAMKSKLKIPLLIGIDAIHGNGLNKGATIYPTPIGMASSWDTALVRRLNIETAREMRATGSHWAFTPNLDIARDARWGRVGETFGEDPFLVTEMGVASIRGLQQGNFTGDNKVIACAKHLIAGSEPVNGLNAAPMDVSEITLREVFLPPYKRAIEEGCFSIMTAHNELNGTPCHSNKWLMEDLMRDEYGFDGFVVSDWMDIERIHSLHKVAPSIEEASILSVAAGMDMHMHGPDFFEAILKAVKDGRISEDRINQSVRKILEVKFRLGLFENPYVDTTNIKNIVFNEEHQKTALETARKSIVLLKNDGILPLDKSKYKRIFVTGPNANSAAILGDWAAEQPENKTITAVEGIKEIAGDDCEIDFYDCGWNIRDLNKEQIAEAASKAKNADLCILVVGENSMRHHWKLKTCGENTGRSDINLPGLQDELVQAIYETGKPVVVVLINGRPLSTNWISENVPALIESWEPGSKGGTAIAEILFGEINPSGKLPISIPRSAGQIQTIYNHKPSHYFHHYAFAKSGPLYPFGFGLSYTTFKYSDITLSANTMTVDNTVEANIKVKNTGSMAGTEIVQLYIRDDYSSVTRPVKELKGFKRVELKAGEEKTVSFTINKDMLSFFNAQLQKVVEPGDFTIMIGSSSDMKHLKISKLSVN